MELNDVLSPTELLEMLAAAHKPSYVSWRLSTYLAAFGKSNRSDTCNTATRHAPHTISGSNIPSMQYKLAMATALSLLSAACILDCLLSAPVVAVLVALRRTLLCFAERYLMEPYISHIISCCIKICLPTYALCVMAQVCLVDHISVDKLSPAKSLHCLCRTEGAPHLTQVLLVEKAISKMTAASSACERIKNTPMPFAIVVHMR